MMISNQEEYSRLPTGRRTDHIPTTGGRIVATMGVIQEHNALHNIDQFNYDDILRDPAWLSDCKWIYNKSLNPVIFVITEPDIKKNFAPHNRDDVKRGIRDVAMREIRSQIATIEKDTMKRFDQFYRMLHSNPHLGHQFHLTSWFHCFLSSIFSSYCKFTLEFRYFIRSYLPTSISCILLIILYLPIMIIIIFAAMFKTSIPPAILVPLLLFYYSALFLLPIYFILLFISSLILLPWYYLSGCRYPMNVELCLAYYRDMFDSNPDLNPPVIIDEMSDKLNSIVDNYTPLPSTASFDYLRFVKETKTITYTMYGGKDSPGYDVEKEVTGSFIEFIKNS